MEACRIAAVCRRWRDVLSKPPTLFHRHLSQLRPPPPLAGHHRPYALVIQPLQKVGRFTHLTLVAVDPGAGRVPVEVPLKPKYVDPPPPPRKTAKPNPDYVRAKPQAPPDLAAAADPAPWEVFFERTVPELDISIAASHGRLLLGRGRSRYYVCDPAANRWAELPPSAVAPSRHTNSGLHYEESTAGGDIAFTVVLLVQRGGRGRTLVETFSSEAGKWEATELDSQGCLGAAYSAGIHVGSCFYWLHLRRVRARGGDGEVSARVLRYDAAAGAASLLGEPPEAERSKGRVARSLGSAGGRLRLCAFDVRDEKSASQLPHGGLEGVHGAWVMEDDGAAATSGGGSSPSWPWRRVHEAVVEDMSTWYFHMLFNHEKPVDFAGACGDFIVVEKEKLLLRYDLGSGTKVELGKLHPSGRLRQLYRRYHVFPLFK